MPGLGVSSRWAPAPVASAPPLPEHHVARAPLARRLAGSQQRLLLLCAPAGFGKSVLARESLAALQPSTQVIWLALEGRAPSLADLCAAISHALGVSEHQAPASLLRYFATAGRPLRVVLDDLSGDLSIELNNWFEQLLGLSESRLQLMVCCRQRPAWDLPRLLLQGELLELDERQLGMIDGQFRQLCTRLPVALEEAARERIHEQCGGWWAAACLLLAGASRGEALLRGYLEREVLARLAVDERRLLFGLCNLPRFSADFCSQLWDGHTGVHLLQRLRQQQVFLQALDPSCHWFRIQPLVADILRDAVEPAELARVRLHACRLLSLAGHLHDAIDQALQAQQPEVAATYIERLKPSWQLAERHLRRVLDWRRQLPAHLLEGTPRLIYLSSLALLLSGRISEALRSLEGLSRFLPAAGAQDNSQLLAHWQVLTGVAQAFRGELAAAEANCRQALEHLAAAPRDWLSQLLCRFTLGRLLQQTGRPEEAQRVWACALEQARRQGCQDSEALLQGERLRAQMLDAQAELAALLLEDCLAGRQAAGVECDPVLGRLLLIRAELQLAQSRPEQGEADLQAAQAHLRRCSAPFVLAGFLGLAQIAGQRGDLALAQAQLQRGERVMQCGQIDEACYQPLLALERLKLLAHAADWHGLLEAGRRVATSYPLGAAFSTLLPPTLAAEVQWLLARAEQQLGRREPCRRRLQALAEHCQGHSFGALQLEALRLLQALETPEEGEEELTGREVAVLEQLARGLSNQEIADALFLSVNTVKYHAKNINAKLGATRRTQAIACAKARGLLA
ncbi:ATP/maltotriose-dependent transcriptional regulator MalT [Pseudomonas nitritireducens]|uniref:ATP/maltotriose-dependent transcriptional regulator MalT n=1 Tax=Pseudomonas nitroreducens TaxID=46680 RepID=A0A7W7KQL7_PSENT|nr:LuxR C-terminal-related transcriptional regulator [Pseudomonas nitritireducens]MBB4866754.1 ATP/maltotriose-dependent transcriptional regulator MalT [Pseudomonas nitritireducens]